MYRAEEYYYTAFNKALLKILGLWPHKKSRFTLAKQLLLIFVIVTYVCLQFLNLVIKKCNMALFAETVSLASPGVIILLQYSFFIINSKAVKNFHYEMRKDWGMTQHEMENKIMQKYAHQAQNISTFVYCFTVLALVIGGVLQILPIILDFVVPLDKPRTHRLIIPIEYFILEDEYFLYVKIFHEAVAVVTCVSILAATGSQSLIFIQHNFGIFKVASHRIQYSIESIILQISDPIKMEYEIRRGVMLAVIAHRRAMEFSDTIVTSFNVQYSVLAVVGVLSLSIIFYRFVEAVTVTKDTQDIIVSLLATSGFLLYMYVANYMGQKINDYNAEIFDSTYNISWYLMPISSQKLILLLKQKTSKDFYFTVGYILVARIESFAMLLNSALSYFAVMYSIQ